MNERDYVVCRLEGGWPGIWLGAQEAKFLAKIVEEAGKGSKEAERIGAVLRSCWTEHETVDAVPLYVKAGNG